MDLSEIDAELTALERRVTAVEVRTERLGQIAREEHRSLAVDGAWTFQLVIALALISLAEGVAIAWLWLSR